MGQVAVLLLFFSLIVTTGAFAPVAHTIRSLETKSLTSEDVSMRELCPTVERQRRSVAPVQTLGFFGLGAPEVGVILVAAAFLFGPQKLAELGRDAGKIAGELKDVPVEFQKGLQEGQARARAMKSLDTSEQKKENKE